MGLFHWTRNYWKLSVHLSRTATATSLSVTVAQIDGLQSIPRNSNDKDVGGTKNEAKGEPYPKNDLF